jgi:hypothetical protein
VVTLSLFLALNPQFKEEFKSKYGELPSQWRDVLYDDLQIADALEQGDSNRASQLIEKHLGDPKWNKAAVAASDPAAFLASHITAGLRGVRVVLWKEDGSGKLRPGLYCPQPRQLTYGLLVAHLGKPGSYTACKRCGGLFQKRRAWQPYCSYKCRVAEAMKRYRAKKKKRERENSRGGKHGRRTKR